MPTHTPSTKKKCAAANVLNTLGITPANTLDVYRIMNFSAPRRRVLNTLEAQKVAPYTALGIGAEDALALANILARTPAGSLLATSLRDHDMYRQAVLATLHLDEDSAAIIADSVRVWDLEDHEETAQLWMMAEELIAVSRHHQQMHAAEAERIIGVLRALTPMQTLVAVRAAQQFWRLQLESNGALVDGLRTVGLVQ